MPNDEAETVGTASGASRAQTRVWSIDVAHSEIHFTVRHLLIARVSGRAKRWRGALSIDDQQPRLSSVEIAIDADSLDTGTPERDEHLRSAEFLDAAAHPQIVFQSRSVKTVDDVDFLVAGDLTIRGATREITLYCQHGGRVRDTAGRNCIILRAHATIDRRDFGLTWNEPLPTGGLVVGDKVELAIEMEASDDQEAR